MPDESEPTSALTPEQSHNVGFSVGWTLFLTYPGWSIEQAGNYARSRTPTVSLSLADYRKGIVDGFCECRIRRMLNLSGKQSLYRGKSLPQQNLRGMPQGENQMPLVVKSTFAKDERVPVWLRVADVNLRQVIFNILNISDSSEKWYLEVMPRLDTMSGDEPLMGHIDDDTEIDVADIDYRTQKLLMSFSRTKGREEDMMAAKDKIRNQGPMYNCYIKAVALPRDQVFYDVSRLTKENRLYIEPPKSLTRPANLAQKSKAFFGVPGMDETVSQDFDPFLDSDDLP